MTCSVAPLYFEPKREKKETSQTGDLGNERAHVTLLWSPSLSLTLNYNTKDFLSLHMKPLQATLPTKAKHHKLSGLAAQRGSMTGPSSSALVTVMRVVKAPRLTDGNTGTARTHRHTHMQKTRSYI